MFDLDDFLSRCSDAIAESEPRRATREVLRRALAAPGEVADLMAPGEAGLTVLHQADDLTVLHVVWAPGMDIWPHDHHMWAVIGIYEGEEDNTFYRRGGPDSRSLTASGGKRIATGDTLLLGDDTIHAVQQPSAAASPAPSTYTAATSSASPAASGVPALSRSARTTSTRLDVSSQKPTPRGGKAALRDDHGRLLGWATAGSRPHLIAPCRGAT